jgi:hypothetical protein
VLTKDGIGYHCELKKVDGKSFGWSFSKLQLHQKDGLLGALKAGAEAWVIVFFQVRLGVKARKKPAWRDLETYEGAHAVTIEQILYARDVQFRTSFSLDDFVCHGVFLPEIVGHGVTTEEGRPLRLWDPTPLTEIGRERKAK